MCFTSIHCWAFAPPFRSAKLKRGSRERFNGGEWPDRMNNLHIQNSLKRIRHRRHCTFDVWGENRTSLPSAFLIHHLMLSYSPVSLVLPLSPKSPLSSHSFFAQLSPLSLFSHSSHYHHSSFSKHSHCVHLSWLSHVSLQSRLSQHTYASLSVFSSLLDFMKKYKFSAYKSLIAV